MGIHPIDLSTVYGQMDQVAKYGASQNQNLQLLSQNVIEKAGQMQLEKSKTVQETGKDEQISPNVKKDGSGSGGAFYQSGRRKKDNSQEEEETVEAEFSDPSLGQHIDIQG